MSRTPDAPPPDAPPPDNSYLFRRAFVRVMTVQVVSLLALWWLQATFAR